MKPRNLERLLRLWTEPAAQPDAAIDAFAEYYADPVIVNGTPFSLAELAERAKGLHRAFSDIEVELLTQVDTPDHTSIAFKHRATHTGTLTTPLGDVAATGTRIERMVIDILRWENGRVCEIHVVPDELGGLLQLGALRLAK